MANRETTEHLARRHLEEATLSIFKGHLFYASLLTRLPLQVDWSCPTGYTDGRIIGYNPEWIEDQTQGVRVTFLCHEVLHVAYLHHLRRNGRDLEGWNKAADYAINRILADTGFEGWDGWLLDDSLGGLAAEEIFRKLADDRAQQEQPEPEQDEGDEQGEQESADGGMDQDDDGDDQQEGSSDDADDETGSGGEGDEEADEPGQETGEGQGEGSPDGDEDGDGASGGSEGDAEGQETGEGSEGSGQGEGSETGSEGEDEAAGGSGAEPGDSDPSGPEPAQPGEVRDWPGEPGEEPVDDADREREARNWQQAVERAAKQAAEAGKLPGSLREMVDDVVTGVSPWRDQFWQFWRARADDDFSWQYPDLRFSGRDYVLPGTYSEGMGVWVIVVDTSGSMDAHAIRTAFGEIDAIKADLRPKQIVLLFCDTSVAEDKVEVYGPDEPLRLDVYGGGGTAFSPAFRWVEEHRNDFEDEVEGLLYLTDLCSSDFGPEPDFPVLWGKVGRWRSDQTPPFGQVVEVRVDM